MKPRPRRQPYLLYCDDSGGEADALRAVAALSGPARPLLALERDLRKVLAAAGLEELKWAGVRTREARLEAARAFLELAAVGAAAGALRIEVLLWRPAQQSSAYAKRSEVERLKPLYARLWKGAAAAWPGGRWNVHPDQRTGMGWERHPPALKAAWRRGGGALRTLREASSKRSACVQLADLLAGLCRHPAERLAGAEAGARAFLKRGELRRHFLQVCQSRGLALKEREGLLFAQSPRLSIRLLQRLPLSA